jgi:hypothetical protein
MRSSRCALTTIAVTALLLSAIAQAKGQWLTNQTAGIPRTADGKVNLAAPAPRAADGRPDLSGVWRFAKNYMDGVDLPLQPWAEAHAKKRATGDGKDDPTAQCLPWGQPRLGAFSVQKIVQTSNLVVVLYEYLTTFRQIFVDGRKPLVNPEPAWMGYSIGRWAATRWLSSQQVSTVGAGSRPVAIL